MGQLIKVELKDGAICRMAPKALDVFLARDKVTRFERSDGWAVVCRDPLRDMKNRDKHSGFDRRIAA